MKKVAAAAIAVSTLALVLSFVALVAATRENSRDDGRDLSRDSSHDEAVTQLAQRVASLEGGLQELGQQQRALAARADELAAPAAFDPAEIRKIIDERTRETVMLATGKARLRPDELPEAVKLAALKVLEGAEIVRAEQRSRKGRTEFRVKARLGGEEYDLKISPDGEVIEAEMPPDRAPQVVKGAAAKAVKGIRLSQVKLEMDKGEGRMVYDVEGRADGEKYDIIVTPDGQLIEVDGPDGKVRFDRQPGDAGEQRMPADGAEGAAAKTDPGVF